MNLLTLVVLDMDGIHQATLVRRVHVYLVTVYYTNILRRNRTTFAFIGRKKLLDRLINITVPVSKIFFSSREESHKDEDMPTTRRTFDVEFKLNVSI